MKRHIRQKIPPYIIVAILAVLSVLLFSLPLVYGEEQTKGIPDSDCFSCHADTGLTKEAPGGKTIALFVDEKKFGSSIHGGNGCVSCHSDITEIPHQENLSKVDCSSCHGDQADVYFQSTHGKAYKAKVAEAPYCTTCHGKHDILPKSDPASKIHPLHQIQICTSCHLNPQLEKKYYLPDTEKIQAYATSIHGRGVMKSGLLVSATCVSCHSAHNVRAKNDPKSTIYWNKIPELCGSCHLGILEDFKESEHGRVWEQKSSRGPGCVTCHGSHGIEDPVTVKFQLSIPLLCGKCHEDNAPTYYDTFHGQALSLGFVRAATCADCHTAHRNLKQSNPASTVNPAHIKETCGKCHQQVSAGFLTFDPHADPTRKDRNALLYYVYKAMTLLLTGVFGFFTLHTLLWLQRAIVGYFRGEIHKEKESDGPYVIRFNTAARIIHAMIMVSFLGLAFTGLPLRFHYANWTKDVLGFIGGVEVSTFLHRCFAILTFSYAAYHVGYLIHRIVFKKERGLLAGPMSMVPRPKDFTDLYHQMRWFLYLGKPARLDRWTYWEKFDYFAVFWGIPVIGLSGLMLWFPGFFSSFLPGYVLNIAKIVHSEEALLAVGFIFVFHFFHTHLRPESFPMDMVMFSGRLPLDRFRRERPEEYARLVRTGELEKRLAGPPGKQARIWGYIGGSVALSIGILLVILILWSVMTTP